jgi:hypothetical protein
MWPFASNSKSKREEYPTPQELRAIWGAYSDQWPDNHDRYSIWKPESILPAPKWKVREAIKLAYAEWPEPVDWEVFSSVFMEFADLANHLPDEAYSVIQRFRQRKVRCAGTDSNKDPLLLFHLSSTLAVTQTFQRCEQQIVRVRDGLRRTPTWDPIGADDNELDAVRQILLKSTTEFATLIQEWRLYILSIGKDKYIQDSHSRPA